ncbi:hypothetical protein CH063_01302 [Colletotrichum higginsianum]|uniref:Uncharacterized protein n=1 Tax=Colletotrichum higginsianum (strain IMI 349063) TaxID=759273 RepID=H1V5A5_COLHI|nr:hypothetical protein CH063_01302 [Colletotrichum higginsianum]
MQFGKLQLVFCPYVTSSYFCTRQKNTKKSQFPRYQCEFRVYEQPGRWVAIVDWHDTVESVETNGRNGNLLQSSWNALSNPSILPPPSPTLPGRNRPSSTRFNESWSADRSITLLRISHQDSTRPAEMSEQRVFFILLHAAACNP